MNKTISQEMARNILGKNFFGIEEWAVFNNVIIPKNQLSKVTKFPWNKDILESSCPFEKNKAVKETHFGFLGLTIINGNPLTIMKFDELYSSEDQSIFFNTWWCEGKFATERTCAFRWYLMPMRIIDDSLDKTYKAQVKILQPNYEIASAVEEVAKNFLYFAKNGEHSSFYFYNRCRDMVSDEIIPTRKYRVVVGGFLDERYKENGFRIYNDKDTPSYHNLAIATSRKPLR